MVVNGSDFGARKRSGLIFNVPRAFCGVELGSGLPESGGLSELRELRAPLVHQLVACGDAVGG